MSYGSNYYNYQIAVIFAILIVALLILAIFVIGIYYAVVVNVRNKKKAGGEASRTRTPSSIPATRTTWQAAPTHQQPIQTPNTPYSPDFPRNLPQDYNYDPRIQPGYIQQQPLVQSQYPVDYRNDIKVVRELQPEYVYQQGPVTWTTNQQVTETYPVSPVQQISGAAATSSAYHMSSV